MKRYSEAEKKEVGNRLREFAMQTGGIGILADKLGMTQGAFSSGYISGRSLPGGEILLNLYILGCDLHWLLTGESKPGFPYSKVINKPLVDKDGNAITNETEKRKDLITGGKDGFFIYDFKKFAKEKFGGMKGLANALEVTEEELDSIIKEKEPVTFILLRKLRKMGMDMNKLLDPASANFAPPEYADHVRETGMWMKETLRLRDENVKLKKKLEKVVKLLTEEGTGEL